MSPGGAGVLTRGVWMCRLPLVPRTSATSRLDWPSWHRLTGPRPGRDSDAFPAPFELPEVVDLETRGWVGLDDAPGLWALPAVWPAQQRWAGVREARRGDGTEDITAAARPHAVEQGPCPSLHGQRSPALAQGNEPLSEGKSCHAQHCGNEPETLSEALQSAHPARPCQARASCASFCPRQHSAAGVSSAARSVAPTERSCSWPPACLHSSGFAVIDTGPPLVVTSMRVCRGGPQRPDRARRGWCADRRACQLAPGRRGQAGFRTTTRRG